MLQRMTMRACLAGAVCSLVLLLSACMPESRSGNVYSRDQARTSHSVYYGTILRVDGGYVVARSTVD